MKAPHPDEVDPFDLPEWLGTDEVTWTSASGPAPVVDDDTRTRAHQAWRHGQVLCVTHPPGPEGRLSLAVPGRDLTAGRALDALARLSKAVGASADDWSVVFRIGEERAATRRGR